MYYKILRFFRDERPTETIARGLTLEQAQAHCNDPRTSKRGEWFDGYFCEYSPHVRDHLKERAVLAAVEAVMPFFTRGENVWVKHGRAETSLFSEATYNLKQIILGYHPSLWTCFRCGRAYFDNAHFEDPHGMACW